MPYEARCKNKNCEQLLFDVSSFEAFNKPDPVTITCRGCGWTYRVSQVEGDIIFKRLHGKKVGKAIRYG